MTGHNKRRDYMSQNATMEKRPFGKIDDGRAKAFLRESAIMNRNQSQSLGNDQINAIRDGKQDQSLDSNDFLYGLTHADQVWDQVDQASKQAA